MTIPVVKTSTSARPLRADAARNRGKVLKAARETFADEGMEAEIAAIAQRAGVGVGTVYRSFPTKVALLTALTEEHFETLSDICERSMERGGSPWEVVERMIWEAAERTAEDHGMCEVLANRPKDSRDLPAAQRLRALTGRMVEDAIAEGTMRPDATIDDIPMMMCGFGRVAAAQRDGSPMDWRRYLQIMLDGMRAR